MRNRKSLLKCRFIKKYVFLNIFMIGVMTTSNTQAFDFILPYYGGNNNTFSTNLPGIASGFTGLVDNNTITDKASSIYGGFSENSKVTNNSVTVSQNIDLSRKIAPIIGNNNTFQFVAGQSADNDATNNRLIIESDVKLKDNWNYIFAGGWGENANSNFVSFENINTKNSDVKIYGGYSDSGDAIGNTVVINGGTFNNVYGGYSGSGKASNNSVYLNGNITLTNDLNVYGSHYTQTGSTDNMVFLNGKISSSTKNNLSITVSDFSDTSQGDRLIIGRNAQFDNIKLDIKAVTGFSVGLLVEANAKDSVVEVWTKNININSLISFKNFYFILPDNIQNGNTILNIADFNDVFIGNQDTSDYHIGVATQSGVNLNIGDQVTLINRVSGILTENTQVSMDNISLNGGSFITDYTFGLSLEGTDNALIATVTGKKANDEIKAPVEAQTASVALLNTGNDLIADSGMDNAISAVKNSFGNLASFGAISGGYSKYKTGSHVDLTNLSLLTGFATKVGNNFLSAIFVEAGYGDYDSHNTFSSGKVKGDGNSKYYGLGVMGRYDLTSSIYTEASARAGYLNNDWESNDTRVPVKYGTDSFYCGASFGLGYDTWLNDSFELDVYGKYFYTHQNGDDDKIDGTKFDFKDINSHMTRFGARFYYAVSDNMKPFIGGAWDREFDGKANAVAGDMSINAPSLKGNTGMFELGLKMDNSETSAWDIDTSVQGFIGERIGMQGLIKAKYNF